MTDTSYDVVAVGNAIVDILAFENDDFFASHGIEKGIMTLTDRATVDKLFIGTPEARRICGGSAANTVVGVASFGGKTAFIGKVGIDPMGSLFTSDIRKMGVDFVFTPPEKETDESTACSYIIVTPDAERTMMTYLGVAAQLALRDINEDIISAAKVCYLEGYLWDDANAIDCMKKAIEVAQAHKREVAFSLSDPFCVDRHRDEFKTLVKNDVDVLFANEDEIISLYQADSLESAIDQVRKDVNIAAITLGAKGSIIVRGDETVEVAAASVKNVVDTTGAGDLYAAGFLSGHTNGKDLARCGELGSIAASEIISHLGARPEKNLEELAK
jgi:sugar/nucleoside kinase (ribokinase family)